MFKLLNSLGLDIDENKVVNRMYIQDLLEHETSSVKQIGSGLGKVLLGGTAAGAIMALSFSHPEIFPEMARRIPDIYNHARDVIQNSRSGNPTFESPGRFAYNMTPFAYIAASYLSFHGIFSGFKNITSGINMLGKIPENDDSK